MRKRAACGRLSGFRWKAPLVWPFAWQSRHVTPRLAASILRSSVWLNCCWGNGVSSRRMPSIWTGVTMPSRRAKKFLIVSSCPFETSPNSGRVVRKGGRKLRQQMVRQIEVGVKALQRPRFLPVDLLHLKVGKDHAAGLVLDVREGQKPLREQIFGAHLVGGHGGQLLPGQARWQFDPDPVLDG